jgi:hypothetical protein
VILARCTPKFWVTIVGVNKHLFADATHIPIPNTRPGSRLRGEGHSMGVLLLLLTYKRGLCH